MSFSGNIEEIKIPSFEKVIKFSSSKVPLEGVIAIHNSKLGPALGGLRCYPYNSFDEALKDVLRLSEGMTLKSAIAQTGTGGGKGVVIMPLNQKKLNREQLIEIGHLLNFFKGTFITAEDIGLSVKEALIIREVSPYIAGIPKSGSIGDPSFYTAFGVLECIRAFAKYFWGDYSLKNKLFSIQGLGSVGSKIAETLFWEGADVIVSDINPVIAKHFEEAFDAKVVSPEEILSVKSDIFVPCALGAILNSKSIPNLRCYAVIGAANNQLEKEEDSLLLQERNIIYAPDFLVNSGGLINASLEYFSDKPLPKKSRNNISKMRELFFNSLVEAKEKNISPLDIMKKIAEKNLL